MRIGELAGLVGISTRAIRHYHRIGLLPEPARKANGYREYSLRDAVELARVRRLTELRRRRARLAQLLLQAEAGGKPCEQAPISADFAPAQAAAVRRAVDLMKQSLAPGRQSTP
jgi:DNA-binding transcriptional MerR regulator